MRIALVSAFPPSRHHLSEYGFHLADELRRRQMDFTVLADEIVPEQPELPGFDVCRCWRVGALDNVPRLLSALRQSKPDLVWFNLVYSTFGATALPAFAGLCAPALTRAFGFRTHITLHHLMENCNLRHADISFPRLYQFAGSIATRLLLRADSISVLLERYRRTLQERYGATHIGVRPHGTLGTPYPPDPALRPPTEFRMLALGKWGRYKRLEVLFDALPAVLEAVPHATLQIAGCDHPNRPGYVANLQEKWGSHPRVQFLGYLNEDQFEDVFRSAHVAVLPYLSSGGPSGVAHIAARFALPIVAANIDDLVRLADEEGLALDTFDPHNSAELASRLIALAHDSVRRDRMAEQNYQVALNTTMPRIVASYLAEFARLLGESPQLPATPEREVTTA
ncbi:MAG TPA: glycosyltransferase [Terracidiphilus sp.]|nr:glycosyltransferase [Terracidiphilus sp.]